MTSPKVSIIIPVYNAKPYLQDTIDSLKQQTFEAFEAIWVDDDSTDGSSDILRSAAEQDSRFVVLHQKHLGAGAARNLGLMIAKGKYVVFLDSDDLALPDQLEKMYQAADSHHADVVACNYCKIDGSNKETQQTGVYTNWLPGTISIFCYHDCPDYIMQITGPMVWNKMYRIDFIRQHDLKFDEISSYNDISFAAISLAVAEKITYINDSVVRHRGHRLSNHKKLDDLYRAVTNTITQVQLLPHYGTIRNSVFKFVIGNYIPAIKKSISTFSTSDVERFYQMTHTLFNSENYIGLKPENLYNGELYRSFLIVQKHDYETMKRLLSRRLIVSLTSYPKRIGAVAEVLNSIYSQTRKADEIVLWLAEEQFPGKEAELPDNLRELITSNRLTIRWCDDLKGHKKYFYALQEYADDIVVTIDDDLLYPRDMLASLYKSYLLYPNAVSTMRAHLILVSEQNQILPYSSWIHEVEMCIHEPCMQLMASGGAGDLYPPGLFQESLFDKEAIFEYCLWADNLWVKALQLVSDVPVVLAHTFEPLRCVGDTQEETLYQINGDLNQYDVQWARISEWLDQKFGPNILVRKLTQSNIGTDIHTIESVSSRLDKERKSNRWKKMIAERKLEEVQDELCRTKDKLIQTENTLQQTELALQQAEVLQQQAKAKLRQAESKHEQDVIALHQSEKSKPIKAQLKELGKNLQDRKSSGHASIRWWFKYLIYLLAWIPEVLLAGMLFYLKNGFKQTVRYAFNKLRKRL